MRGREKKPERLGDGEVKRQRAGERGMGRETEGGREKETERDWEMKRGET